MGPRRIANQRDVFFDGMKSPPVFFAVEDFHIHADKRVGRFVIGRFLIMRFILMGFIGRVF